MAEASHEDAYLHQEPWVKPASGQMSSGQGRGRGRGRGRSRGGRSQKRVMGSRSEAGQKSTTTNTDDGFEQLLGWKGGRTRGRGGRKRGHRSVGRRSARNRQKSGKRVTGIAAERDNSKDMILERTPISSVLKWKTEDIPMQVESPEKSSSSEYDDDDDNDNGQASGDEYDDLMVDNYPGVYDDSQSEHFRQVDYGVDGDEDYDDRVEEEEEDEDDDDGDDVVEDVDVEGYFNGYSDEEGERDISGKQIGNADDITESSSSEYSD